MAATHGTAVDNKNIIQPNKIVHLFNRINSSIGQYRHVKKRYSISSCSISVSVLVFG